MNKKKVSVYHHFAMIALEVFFLCVAIFCMCCAVSEGSDDETPVHFLCTRVAMFLAAVVCGLTCWYFDVQRENMDSDQ